MRGGFLHNQMLIAPVKAAFDVCGAQTTEEVWLRAKSCEGFVDLVAEYQNLRIAVEAELTPLRIPRDIVKAVAIGADELWLIVPNAAVRRTAHQRLRRHYPDQWPGRVRTMTPPQAIQHIRKMAEMPSQTEAKVEFPTRSPRKTRRNA